MYPSYMGYISNFQLPRDDILAIRDLYGERDGTPVTEDTSWTEWGDWGPCTSGQNVRYRTCGGSGTGDRQIKAVRNTCPGSASNAKSCVLTTKPTNPRTTDEPPRTTMTYDEVTYTTMVGNTDAPSPEGSLCSAGFDAILQFSRETFIFQNDMLWRVEGENHYIDGAWTLKGPQPVSTYWATLPSRIDAVYRVPELPGVSWATGHLRFFSGAQYWEYDGKQLQRGFPKSFSELGLPSRLRFDAAVNRRKGKGENFRRFTFLFAGTKYYVFDEKRGKLVGRRNGRSINKLHILGAPNGERIKAAMEGSDDKKSYFFYNDLYYAQDDQTEMFFVGNIKDDMFHCCKEKNGQMESGVQIIRGQGRCVPDDADSSSYDYGYSLRNSILYPIHNSNFFIFYKFRFLKIIWIIS